MIIKGDVNGDGRIDIFDLIAIRSIILNYNDPTDEQLISADINGDGEINMGDLIKIRNHINGEKIIDEVIY